MSKIKMLLDVVQDMRRLTDSLETLARAIEGPEEEQSAPEMGMIDGEMEPESGMQLPEM